MDPKLIQPLMIVAMFAVMYFFFIRPQSQKAKKEKAFVEGLEKGAKVVTTNGIHGTIDKVEDTTLLVEIDRNVKIRIEKSGISTDLTLALNKTAEEKK
ncbi:MAG: preprotein translocase, YajC subunit [Bacteroidetes bacterium]|nr:preprotein translocase, YajC subunit [Bacteroidota bacterium]